MPSVRVLINAPLLPRHRRSCAKCSNPLLSARLPHGPKAAGMSPFYVFPCGMVRCRRLVASRIYALTVPIAPHALQNFLQ